MKWWFLVSSYPGTREKTLTTHDGRGIKWKATIDPAGGQAVEGDFNESITGEKKFHHQTVSRDVQATAVEGYKTTFQGDITAETINLGGHCSW